MKKHQMMIWKWVAICMSLTFMLIAVFIVSYRFDGYMFPVTSRYVIKEIIQTDDQTVIVGTDFAKFRECNLESVNWYKGEYNNEINVATRVKVRSSFVSAPVIRHIGHHQIFSKVRLTPAEILTDAHAIAKHDCYNGWLWYTTTVLYVSKYSNIQDAINDGIKITDNRTTK